LRCLWLTPFLHMPNSGCAPYFYGSILLRSI
jgi:hypothetical protein